MAAQEAAVGSTTRREKTRDYTKVWESAPESGNDEVRRVIEKLVFVGGAKAQKMRNDVGILYMAERLGYSLVTRDGASRTQPGGMLGNAKALLKLGIAVVAPEQAVEEVRRFIVKRGELARQASKATHHALPHWIGLDWWSRKRGLDRISTQTWRGGTMNTVILEVRSLGDAARAMKSGKGEAGARIGFATQELRWQVLTAKRWDLLKAMCGTGPISIREAARRVGRDVKAVHGDVTALLDAGVLRRSPESRVEFPFDSVNVEFTLEAA